MYLGSNPSIIHVSLKMTNVFIIFLVSNKKKKVGVMVIVHVEFGQPKSLKMLNRSAESVQNNH